MPQPNDEIESALLLANELRRESQIRALRVRQEERERIYLLLSDRAQRMYAQIDMMFPPGSVGNSSTLETLRQRAAAYMECAALARTESVASRLQRDDLERKLSR